MKKRRKATGKRELAHKASQASKRREAAAHVSRELSAAVAEIGDIPDIVNPERRAACEFDLVKFLVTYFPRTTGSSPFSEDHLRGISRIERCCLHGGLYLNLFPRGFAKTTITENSSIW